MLSLERFSYLLNGNRGIGDVVNLNDNGTIRKQFKDISEIDLITMDIKDKESKNVIREYNHDKDLLGYFYIGVYPYPNDTIRTYAPIFNYNKEILNKYYDNLKEFAYERLLKVNDKDRLQLDLDNDLKDYIDDLLYKIMNNNVMCISNKDSIISNKLKSVINDRYDRYFNRSTEDYMKMKSSIIYDILSSYTELRGLTLEYMLYLSGNNTNIRNKYKNPSNWNNFGITKEANKSEIFESKQMELADYMSISRVRRVDKKGKPIL